MTTHAAPQTLDEGAELLGVDLSVLTEAVAAAVVEAERPSAKD